MMNRPFGRGWPNLGHRGDRGGAGGGFPPDSHKRWYLAGAIVVLIVGLIGWSQLNSEHQVDQQIQQLKMKFDEERKAREVAEEALRMEQEKKRAQQEQQRLAELARLQRENEQLEQQRRLAEKRRIEELQEKQKLEALLSQEQKRSGETARLLKEEQSTQPPVSVATESDTVLSNGTNPKTSRMQPKGYKFPAGSVLVIRTIQNIATDRMTTGDQFDALLEEALMSQGVEVAPKGSTVWGRITRLHQAGRVSGRSELGLELLGLQIGSTKYLLDTAQYEARGKGQGASTAKSTAAGAALGAVIGALGGGGKGAARGAAAGSAVGLGTALLIRGQRLSIPAETVLEFTLASDVTISEEE